MSTALQRLHSYYASAFYTEHFNRLECGYPYEAKLRRGYMNGKWDENILADGLAPSDEVRRTQRAFVDGEIDLATMLSRMQIYITKSINVSNRH